jgi:hypothetical protein
VFAYPGQAVLLSLSIGPGLAPMRDQDSTAVLPDPSHNTSVTLSGLVIERLVMERVCGSADHESAKDFAYSFVGRQYVRTGPGEAKPQHGLRDGEPRFDGSYKGIIQFSKFRWAVIHLEPCTEALYTELEVKSEGYIQTYANQSSQELIDEATSALEKNNLNEAVNLFTVALSKPLDDEEPDEMEEGSEWVEAGQPSTLRLLIVSGRSQASYELQTYHTCIRDVELLERLYGEPAEVIHILNEVESVAYYRSILRRAFAYKALGKLDMAAQCILSVMVLDVLLDETSEADEDGEAILPRHVAKELLASAEEGLQSLNYDPNTVMVYSLRVELEGTDPLVWRTLDVVGETTLEELLQYLTTVVGWRGGEFHEFVVDDYGPIHFTHIPDEEESIVDIDTALIVAELDSYEDERYATIAAILSKVGDQFAFVYEKAWTHRIVVEAVRHEIIPEDDTEDTLSFPKCTGGQYACPPDEVGGPSGYTVKIAMPLVRCPFVLKYVFIFIGLS